LQSVIHSASIKNKRHEEIFQDIETLCAAVQEVSGTFACVHFPFGNSERFFVHGDNPHSVDTVQNQ
jgi:hypothetical protein